MRRVMQADELAGAFRAARSEAASSFGDDAVYIEKLIVGPRHIEVQILSDAHGNHVHLFERDCSIQRRNQKVVEETPCPVLADDTREAMAAVAVRAAVAAIASVPSFICGPPLFFVGGRLLCRRWVMPVAGRLIA